MTPRRILTGLLSVYALNIVYIETSVLLKATPPPAVFAFSTLLAFSMALIHAQQRMGWRRMLSLLGLTFSVSLLFECVGVATGWIYGPYHYTDQLGPRFLGLVPLYIPLGWFLMSYPSFVIADWLIPADWARPKRVPAMAALAALVMTSWDVVLDPVRVEVGQWVWEVDGPYFGVPLLNFWGWWMTTYVTLTLFLLLSRKAAVRPENPSFDRLALVLYALTGLGEISGALVIGLGGPALAGLFAMAPWVILGWITMREKGVSP